MPRIIGIDLGTVNVLVYVSGKGIVLQEPSVVAISERDSKIVAVGHEARDMLGRTPESIEVARPLRAGVVAEAMVAFVLADALLEKLGGDSLAEMQPRFAALRQARLEDLPMDDAPWRFGFE